MILKEVPYQEWPREKALREGFDKLSNIELLSIFLRTGTKETSVLEVSSNLLYHLSSITDLNNITINELTNIKGIGNAKAITLLAAIELGRRLQKYEFYDLKLSSANDIFNFFYHELSKLSQEHLYAIYFNTKGKVINYKLISIGTNNSCICDSKELFKWAVKFQAQAFVLVHNHPSGDSYPSSEDVSVTRIINTQAKIMNITLLDHIIIGREYFSFAKNKLIERS